MTLSELCQRDILTLSAEASVQKAADLMRTQHVGALALTAPEDPVLVVGVVTDRDLVVNLLAQGRAPDEQSVGAYSSVHWCGCLARPRHTRPSKPCTTTVCAGCWSPNPMAA